MAKEAGTNVLLYVSDGSASPTSFVAVAGQQNTTFQGDTTTDDITDKTHSGWSSTLNVLRGGTVNVSGKADWPDTTGLDEVRDSWENGNDIEGQIVLNSTGSKYTGFFQVTAFQVDGAHNNATNYSFTLQNNGPLTYAAS